MITKKKLKEEIDKFPQNEISIEELIERLIFIEKLEKRIYKSEHGSETISGNQLKEDMGRWEKSDG